MPKNNNLHNAKREKNDEFYTLLSDIENELKHYKSHFIGKIIYCNCDDCFESNFFKYFALNFKFLGLKRLIATCYNKSAVRGQQLTLFDDDNDNKSGNAYYIDIEEKDIPNKDGWNENDIKELCIKKAKLLNGDGDFRSKECIELLKQSDIVVTNPPFSLFREYVAQLMEYDKKFLIIGNINAITYKEFFPLLKDNKVWIGYGFNQSLIYKTPYENNLESNKKFVKSKGYNPDDNFIIVPSCAWYTNLDIKKRHEDLILYKTYNEKEYPKYDNYDAINVDKVSDIPMDYDGVMGVPITFLDKYNLNQFDILQLCASHGKIPKGIENESGCINGKWCYARILIKNKTLN